MTETDEFTKPKRGQIVAEFDEYPMEHEFSVSFDIMINSAKKGYSNILFATNASPDRDINQNIACCLIFFNIEPHWTINLCLVYKYELTVSLSPETLVNADFDDLLNPTNDVDTEGYRTPEINRIPAMWIMPGKANDEEVGFMICGEYFHQYESYSGFRIFLIQILKILKWFLRGYQFVNQPKSMTRCWSHENVESWKKLSVGKW